jgi:hypothetical protein
VLHYVLPAEIYSQNLRSKSETVGAVFGGTFQIISIKVAPLIIEYLPNGGMFFLYAGFLSFFLIWIFISLPETKGIKLEDMEIAFSNRKRWQPIDVERLYQDDNLRVRNITAKTTTTNND